MLILQKNVFMSSGARLSTKLNQVERFFFTINEFFINNTILYCIKLRTLWIITQNILASYSYYKKNVRHKCCGSVY